MDIHCWIHPPRQYMYITMSLKISVLHQVKETLTLPLRTPEKPPGLVNELIKWFLATFSPASSTETGLKVLPWSNSWYPFFYIFEHNSVSKISCQISIYYEQQNSCFFNLSFQEFTATINFPCSKSGLRIGENDVIFSKIPHGLRL